MEDGEVNILSLRESQRTGGVARGDYTRFLSKSLVLPNTSISRRITSILRGPLLYAVFSLKSGTPDYRV